jgi:hypothetical protein
MKGKLFGSAWTTRKPSDAALALGQPVIDQGGIYDGTVGWQDGQAHYDIDPDSGVTLVRVTLFKGRNPGQDGPVTDALAHGHQILCRIGAPLSNIPPLNAQVMVAMAADRMLTPGGGVIFAMPIKSPGTQFAADKAKLDFGPDYDLVIKARSVTLTDYENRFLTVGPTYGIKCGDVTGSGLCIKDSKLLFYAAVDKTGVCSLELSENKVFAMCTASSGGQSSGFKFSGGNCTVYCQQYANTASSGMLGGTASPVSGVQYGPGFGIPSTSWKVAP